MKGFGKFLVLGYPGYVLTCHPLLSEAQCPVSAVAVTNCVVYRVPWSIFHQMIQKHEEIMRLLLAQQQMVMGDPISTLLDHRTLTGEQRFQKLTIRLFRQLRALYPDAASICLPSTLSQRDIAQIIGLSVEEVSRIKRRLVANGILDQQKRQIIVRRPELLFGYGTRTSEAFQSRAF
ncbi:MAG TPA: Crp/Fnr family transcriptional regulator [Bryobacteraceae bacterium]|jgi:CRP-like cAMP-binding protein|nr:Crp/Fnr family transcriptional regulator [Bryobacteraceae bacterium]